MRTPSPWAGRAVGDDRHQALRVPGASRRRRSTGQDGGSGISSAGEQVGAALQGIPLSVRARRWSAWSLLRSRRPLDAIRHRSRAPAHRRRGAARAAGGAAALAPWLNRYVPWRVARWRRLNAAARSSGGARSRLASRRGSRCRPHPGLARAASPRVRRAARVHARSIRRLGRRAPRPAGAGRARSGRPPLGDAPPADLYAR